jgi:hypothetical protein
MSISFNTELDGKIVLSKWPEGFVLRYHGEIVWRSWKRYEQNTSKKENSDWVSASKALISRGYRRISNKHGVVSRIDRADWITVIAQHLNRSPAELYVPGRHHPEPCWNDYYRRVLSKDQLKIGKLVHDIPTSDFDAVGFIDLEKAS